MRRIGIIGRMGVAAILVAALVVTMGVTELRFDSSRIGSNVGATYQGQYVAVATLTSANGDPAVGARNYADLAAVDDSAVAIWEVPRGANAATFRFHIDADAATATVRAATCRSRYNPGDVADDFNVAYQWAITGGTQTDSDSTVYADTITAAAYALAGGTLGSNPANWIAEYEIDLRGVSYVAFYRTDAESVTVVVDAAVR
jgi:hypothetical protein